MSSRSRFVLLLALCAGALLVGRHLLQLKGRDERLPQWLLLQQLL